MCSSDLKEPQDAVRIGLEAAKRRIYRGIEYRPNLEGRLEAVYGEGIRRAKNTTRKEQVILAQLRAGHCPKTKYYQHRIGMSDDARCERCGQEESKDHWLECDAVGDGWLACGVPEVRSGVNNNVLREGFSSSNSVFPSVVGHLGDEVLLGRFLRRAYPQWLA